MTMWLRRLGALAACLALAGTAAGGAGAGQGDPKKAYTAADQALAKRIALRQSDLPAGWAGKVSKDSGSKLSCQGFEPDLSDLTKTGTATSPDFSLEQGTVYSKIDVFKTAAQTRAAYDRVVKPGLLTCLTTVVKEAGESSDVTAKILLARERPVPRVADQTTGYRIVASLESAEDKSKGTLYLDLFLLRSGRVVAAMFFSDFPQAFDQTLERSLVGKVAGRMRG